MTMPGCSCGSGISMRKASDYHQSRGWISAVTLSIRARGRWSFSGRRRLLWQHHHDVRRWMCNDRHRHHRQDLLMILWMKAALRRIRPCRWTITCSPIRIHQYPLLTLHRRINPDLLRQMIIRQGCNWPEFRGPGHVLGDHPHQVHPLLHHWRIDRDLHRHLMVTCQQLSRHQHNGPDQDLVARMARWMISGTQCL